MATMEKDLEREPERHLNPKSDFISEDLSRMYVKVRPCVTDEVVSKVIGFLSEKVSTPFPLLLDMGCGPGLSTVRFAPHFDRVIAADISHTQIMVAREERSMPNISYQVRNANCLPDVETGSATMVNCTMAAHLLDLPFVYEQCEKVLIPGGIIAFETYKTAVPEIIGAKTAEAYHVVSKAMDLMAAAVLPFFQKWLNNWDNIVLPYPEQILITDNSLHVQRKISVDELIDLTITKSGIGTLYKDHPEWPVIHEFRRILFEAFEPDERKLPIIIENIPWEIKMCRKPMSPVKLV